MFRDNVKVLFLILGKKVMRNSYMFLDDYDTGQQCSSTIQLRDHLHTKQIGNIEFGFQE